MAFYQPYGDIFEKFNYVASLVERNESDFNMCMDNYNKLATNINDNIEFLLTKYYQSGQPDFIPLPKVAKKCNGLYNFRSTVLRGSQAIISNTFKDEMQAITKCAVKYYMRLYVVSTSRCNIPPNNPQAVQDSLHQMGQAIDVQPILKGAKKPISKEQMAQAWCAFNMKKHPCNLKYRVKR